MLGAVVLQQADRGNWKPYSLLTVHVTQRYFQALGCQHGIPCSTQEIADKLCWLAVLGKDKTELGLLTDDDHLWKKNKREKQKDQIKRAETFLETLFNNAEEQVIFVVTHSGFIRSLLLAVDREP